MAGRILRIKDMIVHTGLSRTVIYDRMDEKSPRYAKDFPKSFSLGGKAIGWFQLDVDAWLESCADPKQETKAKKSKPSPDCQKTEVDVSTRPSALSKSTIPSSKPSTKSPSTPKPLDSQSLAKQPTRPSNLAETIVEGGKINARLQEFLQLKEWTPAMGAMLVSGIEPAQGSEDIPNGGMGLDAIELHTSSSRFHQARRILRDWHEWKEDAGDPVVNMEPTRYLNWCRDEGLDSDWLRLLLDLAGMTEIGAVDLTASRFAMLTNR